MMPGFGIKINVMEKNYNFNHDLEKKLHDIIKGIESPVAVWEFEDKGYTLLQVIMLRNELDVIISKIQVSALRPTKMEIIEYLNGLITDHESAIELSPNELVFRVLKLQAENIKKEIEKWQYH